MGPGDIIGGRFELEREAGSGGMSRVFQARDRDSGARVAVKVLKSSGHIEREATVLAQLAMPGVVGYVAHGSTGDRPYLVLEWLDGADLDRVLAERGLTIA